MFAMTFSFTWELLLVCVLVMIPFIYWCETKNYRYWKDRTVPYEEPSFIFGNLNGKLLKKETIAEFGLKFYSKFKEMGYGGVFLFRTPAFFACDQDLIERILVTDFAHFSTRFLLDDCDPIAKSLYFDKGDSWRNMRLNLTSSFTSSKIRGMFDQIFKCGDNILSDIKGFVEKRSSVHIEPLVLVYSTEVIASCGFGVQLMSNTQEGKRFEENIKLLFDTSTVHLIKVFITLLRPNIAKYFGFKLIPKKVTEYFLQMTKEIIKYRQENDVKRNDFLQIMLELKNTPEKRNHFHEMGSSDEDTVDEVPVPDFGELSLPSSVDDFSEELIAAMLLNFLSAGTNPSLVTISLALFEIARNSTIQNKLHEEIDSAILKHGQWNYDAVRDMKFVDQVIQETLRLYTYNPLITRAVSEPYKVPRTNLTLKKGMYVYVPAGAIHMDPKYYPSPEVFNPARFEGYNYKPSSTFLPFGDGPRMCVCVRFAITMIKVCIARILYQHTITVSDKMKLPLVLDKHSFFPKAVGGIWLTFDERKGI